MDTSIGMAQQGTVDRQRRDVVLWLGWGLTVASAVAYAVWALHILLDAPGQVSPWWMVGGAAIPISIVAASIRPIRARAGTVLSGTLVVGGIVSMVLSIYLITVVGLGQDVDGTEHRVLGLSMAAAFVSVILAGPLARRLKATTDAWTEGSSRTSTAAIETFGARMTRAVPMDELLLQLAETLRDSMATAGAEVWVGESGVLERAVSVPDRGRDTLRLVGAELGAVSGARVSGAAWGNMWMPEVLDGLIDDGQDVRVAPISHLGKLLGLIVVARSATDGAFRPADEVALADLARTLGLALHNVGLDSALQKSLEELERRNAELQASRTRIVSAADESRRRIERNLHDGAQQHLVALALKVRLLQRKFATDDVPLSTALDVFHDDIQTTIDEVRELAHGIYPPLLRDRGLRAALQASATRSPMPTIVEATEVRFAPDVEAAVYFCCMEAMQNAAKYAGDGATISVTVTANEPGLTFSVQDDGAGFDPDTVRESHGFVNMRDRVGAHGGDISVESSVGHGTTILGNLPVDHMDPQAD